jgi:DNA-binding NtrC family response regulator
VLQSAKVSDWEGGATRQTTASDKPPQEARLSLVIYHDAGTLVVPLILHGAITVGRTDAADVVVPEDSLSRKHARVSWGDEGVWVEDLGSTNGTFVGGRKITRALVAPGDDITLGSVIASLHLVDPRSAVQPVVTEEAFEQWLREAIERCKSRDRPLSLLMVRELGQRQGHLGRWLPRLRAQLRGNEHIGVYGPGWVVLGSESTDYDAAERLAAAIVASPADDGPALACAVAVAPEAGSTFDELIGVVRELSDHADESQPVQSARTRASAEAAGDGPVIVSATMRALYDTARRVAASHVPVLIYGETGAGKELIARAIHAQSPRANKPLLTINCGSVPGTLAESVLFGHERGAFTSADRRRIGAFEQAHGGTIFLDEIGELPPTAQAALLRAIENQRIMRVGSTTEVRVDVRILAATNQPLEALCETGEFRQDLLFRLNAVTLTVPPLRDRVDEIEPLAQHFLEFARRASHARALSLSDEALAKLRRHSWPGNVRELRNAIERAVILAAGPTIEPQDLHLHTPPNEASSRATMRVEPVPSARLKDQVRAYEAELIIDALKSHGWNQTEAARALNIPVRTLAHKIQLYGLKGRFPKGG